MKASSGFGLMAIGGVLVAGAAIYFFQAQSALNDIESLGNSFSGMGGFILVLTDAVGITDVAEQRQQLQIIRGVMVGIGFVGMLLGISGLVVMSKGVT